MKRFNKLHLIPVVLGVFVAAFSVGYLMNKNSNQTASASSCQENCIKLNADKASPDTLAVPKDTFVEFVSSDGKSHSLSLGEGGEEHSHKGTFNSGEFQADEAWRVQFKEEGSYVFHDHFNPKINVLVVVYEPGKDYKLER